MSSSQTSTSSSSGGGSGSKNNTNQIIGDLLQLSKELGFEQKSALTNSFATASLTDVTSKSVSPLVAGSTSTYLSEVEQSVLRSLDPIDSNETDVVTVNGENGLWLNKSEVANWRGLIPLSQYVINQDANPQVVTKASNRVLEYVQELAIRYLRPPTPPAPGEIIINQEANVAIPPAPPLILRQQPARAQTPEPMVVREAPPQPPPQVGRKVVTISGKQLPPPPRKVVVERLPPLPAKPQSIFVERWLPYAEVKRRVIFNRNTKPDPVVVTPRNVIVQWEAPEVRVTREFKYLGVIRANPVEYVKRYGQSLVMTKDLPQFVLEFKTPDGLVLAADYEQKSLLELEGDVEALRLVDLEKEGLGEYRSYLNSAFGYSKSASTVVGSAFSATDSSASRLAANAQMDSVIETLFDQDNSGFVSVENAEKLVLKLNSRLGRNYGEDDVRAFFASLDLNRDGKLTLSEFKLFFLKFIA